MADDILSPMNGILQSIADNSSATPDILSPANLSQSARGAQGVSAKNARVSDEMTGARTSKNDASMATRGLDEDEKGVHTADTLGGCGNIRHSCGRIRRRSETELARLVMVSPLTVTQIVTQLLPTLRYSPIQPHTLPLT